MSAAEVVRFGRWTVVRRATPAQRYGETVHRTRVWVRCACGYERIVFVNDLRSGKTTGCRSRACQDRWRAAQLVRERLGSMEQLFGAQEADDG